MDDPTIIHDIYKLAQIAAEKQVKAEHWMGEAPSWCAGRRPAAQVRTMIPSEPEVPSIAFRAWYRMAKAFSYLRSALVRWAGPRDTS